jgi:hypothetical protein
VNELFEEGAAETMPDPEQPEDLRDDERREDDEPDEDVESHPLHEEELLDVKGCKPMKSLINLANELLPRIECPLDEIEAQSTF